MEAGRSCNAHSVGQDYSETHILLTPDLMQLLMGTSISCILEPAVIPTHIKVISSKLTAKGSSMHSIEGNDAERTKFDSGHGPEPSQGIV